MKIYVCSECGNVKGEATAPNGHQYGDGDICTVCGADKSLKKNYGKVSIAPGESYTLDLSGIENGTYSVVAKVDSEAVANTLLVSTKHATITSTYIYDMYMPLSKTYQSVLSIKDSKDTASVKNNSEETIEVELSVVDYKAPTIKLGEEVEVPCIPPADGVALVILDAAIVADGSTQYKISVTNYTGIMLSVTNQVPQSVTGLPQTLSYTKSGVSFPEGTTALRFQSSIAPSTGTSAMNITIKVESV